MLISGVATRGYASRALAVCVFLLGSLTLAAGQAGGPEYFRIIDLKTDDHANVRSKPDVKGEVVGKIPKGTDGVKNHGCKGGLTPQQWEKASAARKKEDERAGWCEVEFKGAKGWVSRRLLVQGTGPKEEPLAPPPADEKPKAAEKRTEAQPVVAPPPPEKIEPGFDCEKASTHAEKLICADQGLAALDREVARLYGLASDALNAMPGFEDLLDGQRKWIAQRNTCFDNECLAEMYVRRVHQLRQSYSAARVADNKSRSAGPYVLRCEGLDALVGVTVVTTNPGCS